MKAANSLLIQVGIDLAVLDKFYTLPSINRQHQALCHLRLGQYEAARSLLEAGLAALPDHLGFVDALARVLASSPDSNVRDGTRALELAEQAVALRRRTETLETMAMAHAEVGHYDDAITWQDEAIQAAEQVGHRGYLAHLRHNRQRYQQGTPCPSRHHGMVSSVTGERTGSMRSGLVVHKNVFGVQTTKYSGSCACAPIASR